MAEKDSTEKAKGNAESGDGADEARGGQRIFAQLQGLLHVQRFTNNTTLHGRRQVGCAQEPDLDRGSGCGRSQGPRGQEQPPGPGPQRSRRARCWERCLSIHSVLAPKAYTSKSNSLAKAPGGTGGGLVETPMDLLP